MKKIAIIACILIMLMTIFSFVKYDFNDKIFAYASRVEVHLHNQISGFNCVQSGNNYLVVFDLNNQYDVALYDAMRSGNNWLYIGGFSIYCYDVTVDKISQLFNASLINKYSIDDVDIYEFYCNRLSDNVVVDTKRFNLQIAKYKGYIIVGYPCIYGSF